jgi:hypothetical protein
MMRQRKQEVADWAQEWYPSEWSRVKERLAALPNATVQDALRDFEEQERLAVAEEARVRALQEIAKLPGGDGGGEEGGDGGEDGAGGV